MNPHALKLRRLNWDKVPKHSRNRIVPDSSLISSVLGSFSLIFLNTLHSEPNILGSDRFSPGVLGQFQSLLSHPYGKVFHYFSQFLGCIIPYSPGTAPFYEPMNRSGRYLALCQLWARFRGLKPDYLRVRRHSSTFDANT